MQPYVRSGTHQPDLQRVENSLIASFQSIITNPLLNSPTLKKAVVLTSGVDNVVDHGLSRPVTGWIIVDKNASADIYQSTTVNTMPTTSIMLKTTNTVTVSILFF
jgi:hypothetical protein